MKNTHKHVFWVESDALGWILGRLAVSKNSRIFGDACGTSIRKKVRFFTEEALVFFAFLDVF